MAVSHSVEVLSAKRIFFSFLRVKREWMLVSTWGLMAAPRTNQTLSDFVKSTRHTVWAAWFPITASGGMMLICCQMRDRSKRSNWLIRANYYCVSNCAVTWVQIKIEVVVFLRRKCICLCACVWQAEAVTSNLGDRKEELRADWEEIEIKLHFLSSSSRL